MTEAITGIIHVHSDFSRDGLSSVANLAEFARDAGFGFVGLTDHAEDLSLIDLKCLRRQCEEHSDETCVMIPGLEFRCREDIHILGLGVTDMIPPTDAIVTAHQIGMRGGLAILAHPSRNGYQCPHDLCRVLHGIEMWNAAYDGRFVPPLASLRLLQEARSANPAIYGFGGADLHGLDQHPGVVLELRGNGCSRIERQMVLQSLQRGSFAIRGRCFTLDAHAVPNSVTRSSLWVLRKLYEVATAIRGLALGEDW